MQQSPLRALLELGLWPAKQLIEKRRSLRGWLRPILYLFSIPLVVGAFALGALGYLFSGLADLFTGFRFKLTKRFYQLTNKPVSEGRYEVEQFLRKKGRALSNFFGGVHDLEILSLAAGEGDLKLVQYLATAYPPSDFGIGWALGEAASAGHLEVVQHLLGLNFASEAEEAYRKEEALIKALQAGHLDIVRYLIEQQGVEPSFGNSEALISAAANGRLEMIEYFLGFDSINPAAQDNVAIIVAAQNGHLEAVQYLASLDRVNPGGRRNEAIIRAADNGHLEVVQYLAGLDEVNPGDRDNEPIRVAAAAGHLDVVRYLSRVERGMGWDTAQNNYLAYLAAQNGHLDMLRYLVNLRNMNIGSPFRPELLGVNEELTVLSGASQHREKEIVRFLLRDGQVSVNEREISKARSVGANGDVVKLLEEVPAFLESVRRGDIEAVREVLASGEINPSINRSEAMRLAVRHGHIEIVRAFLLDSRIIFEPGENSEGHFFNSEEVPQAIEQEMMALIEKVREFKEAAERGDLAELERLVDLGEFNPAINANKALCEAAQNGHLKLVEYLSAFEDINLAYDDYEPFRIAAQRNHPEVVRYFAQLDGIDLSAGNYCAYLSAAGNGHLELLQDLIRLQDIPVEEKNRIFYRAVQMNRPAVVAYLLTLEGVNPAAQDSRALRFAAERGNEEVLSLLLADGRARVTPNILARARMSGHLNTARLLEDHLADDPSEQFSQLLAAHRAILVHERQAGIFDWESSMDTYLERQAAEQRNLLSERYAEESLSSGQCLLTELDIRDLQSHIQSNSPEAEEKLRFLSERMDKLIAGETDALSGAAALFDSNEDIYEMASRTVNAQAQVMKDPSGNDIWPNLLTAEGDAGEWVQSYAGNIAREIAASEGQPHHDTCLYALIYRLAEIRRAHNEVDLIGTDNPSCFPGAKTRLLKVLGSHPEHANFTRVEWKAACYEGAVRHIEQMFGQVLDEIDSPEEAEQLLDALLMMRLENEQQIRNGEPIMMISGERAEYSRGYSEKRRRFIQRVREGLQESVNAYLREQALEPISVWGTRLVYLHFLEKALGEEWIASRLSAVYSEHILRADSEEVLEEMPQAVFSLRMPQLHQRQALQGLKTRFYEYCEQNHPEVEVSVGEVNAFFAGVEIPDEADEAALFEDAFEQLASGESNEGRQSPSP